MFKEKVNKILAKSDIDILRKYQLVELEMLLLVDKICRENNLKYWIDSGTLLGAIRHKGFIPWDDDCDICMPRDDYKRFNELLHKNILPNEIKFGNRYTKEWIQKHKTEKHGFTQLYYLDSFKALDIQVNQVHIGAFIDIFPVDYVNEEISNKALYKIINKIIHMERKNMSNIKDLIKHTFQKLPLENIWIKKCNKLSSQDKADYVLYGIETVFMESKYMQRKDCIYPLIQIEFEGELVYAPCDYDTYLKNLYGDYMKLPSEDQRCSHLIDLEV